MVNSRAVVEILEDFIAHIKLCKVPAPRFQAALSKIHRQKIPLMKHPDA